VRETPRKGAIRSAGRGRSVILWRSVPPLYRPFLHSVPLEHGEITAAPSRCSFASHSDPQPRLCLSTQKTAGTAQATQAKLHRSYRGAHRGALAAPHIEVRAGC